MAFLPGHDVECCTGNVNRFMPYYVEQMWLRAPDNGLVIALLVPSTVSTVVGKGNVKISISEVTNYPFSESVDFIIQTQEDVQFSLYIRIPSWCKKPQILVNREVITEIIKNGTFYKLDRIFRNSDVITLNILMEIETCNWPNNGIAFNGGPLTYILSIEDNRSVLEGYERSTESFPGWELYLPPRGITP